jgi:hypothetical protein
MDLVEVDPVGAEALEAGVALLGDPAARVAELVRVVAHRAVDLRGEDDVVAPAFERLVSWCIAPSVICCAAVSP